MASLKQKTASGLLWSGMNNVAQQFVGLVFGIVLGRLLMPEDYGMIAMITVFQMLASALQDSGFRTGLINLSSPSHADYNSVFWFNVAMAVALYLILFFCAPLIAAFYSTPALVPLCRYVFLAVIVNALGTSQIAWLYKNMRIKQVAKAGMTAVVVSSLVGVAMAFAGCSYWSLATQNLVYVSANTALLWRYSGWRPGAAPIAALAEPLRRLFPFSVKILATNLALHVNNNVLNVLLGRFFGRADAGLYNQAYQWNFKGQSVVQNMVGMVAQPVLVGLRGEPERELAALRKLVRFTAFLSFPLMLGFGLVAREFIVLTITDKWLVSAALIQVMCVSGAVSPVCAVLSNLVISRGRSGLYFWSTSLLGLSLIAAVCAIYAVGHCPSLAISASVAAVGSLRLMVIAYTAITSAWLFVWFALVRRLCGYRLIHFIADLAPFALAAAAVMALTWFVTRGIAALLPLLLVRVAVAAVLYFLVMRLSNARILADCVAYLRRKP